MGSPFGFAVMFEALKRFRSRFWPARQVGVEEADDGAALRAASDAGDAGLYQRLPAWERWQGDHWRLRHRLGWALRGVEREPIPSYLGLIEDPQPGPATTGVCCSGGGIRSAAFNLGALQALQSAHRLENARYLSAVSGGSYIAAAFAMVAKTHPLGDPQSDDSDPSVFDDEHPPFYRGSPEEQYLRNNSSYLAPARLGKLRLVLRIALGLLVNLAVLAAALSLAASAVALYYRVAHPGLLAMRGEVDADVQDFELLAVAIVAVLAITLGVLSLFPRSRYDRWRQALETLSLIGLALAAVLAVIGIALPELAAFLRNNDAGRSQSEVVDAAGGLAAVLGGGFGGLLAAVLLELRSKLSVTEAKEAVGWFRKLGAGMQRLVAQLAAWVVGPVLLLVVFVLALLVFVSADHIAWWAIAGVAGVFLLFWLLGDVTSWSLHAFYKRRLCTAFALKRVSRGEGDTFGRAVERDYRELVPLSKSGVEPGSGQQTKTWPTLIVCAAANVSDNGATPPGRGVTSITFSPIAMGGPLIGGVPTRIFEACIGPNRQKDFTLPAAVAMSGAAVSPSMGKETRRAFRFLLGLANVRLGVWVPNPRRVERWADRAGGAGLLRGSAGDTGERGGGAPIRLSDDGQVALAKDAKKRRWVPRPGPQYLIKEMLGWNSLNDPYLYVTDGGHYENLGLVELLRRGCTEIFCFDASGGTSLSNLGDAIALARSELKVEIAIDPSELAEDGDRIAKKACVRGEITYPNGVPGVLVYARSVVTESAPFDVQAFRLNDDAFPHHSTFDQLFTDQKFEAYRELGAHVGRAALVEAAQATPGAAAQRKGEASQSGSAPARSVASP